ncbi:B-cell receptor CD22 [Merluccius polli]|uniref:B-cell receptor CD22 n=1 Tax=Merluccius polli TaxID=89951 RepID=A0AA47MC27_MERPO|nr:B-cell receptor CD22 [Merluccius polli]
MALFLKYFSGVPGNSCHRVSYPTRTMCVLQGTPVDISCTYSHPSYATLTHKYWFKLRANQEPRDLQSDSEYEGRAEYPVEETGRSTLRITDLRVTDSAEYRFTFRTSHYEWKSILHGTTLTVTGLRVLVTPVATVTEGQRVTLTCITSCPLADKRSYIWYQNNGSVTGSENPENQLVLDPVGPQHAGSYSCSVRNYAHLRSPEETLTVQCTMSLRVEVTPVATVTEGQRVTLTCITSCPLADKPTYIWYQNNGPVNGSENPENQLVLDPVGPQHAGSYSCSVRNYPHLRSPEETLTVQYAPQTPSVSVSPSGEVVEGSSVTLSCSSDANPAANYTWFKEHEDSVGEPGQNYTITNITSELGGHYYCQAHNAIGRQNSTLLFINVTGNCYFKKPLPDPEYDDVLHLTNRLAPAAQREPIEEQDDIHNVSIHISHSENQEPPSLHVCCDHAFHQLNLCVLFILNEMCLFFTALQGNDDWTVTCTSSNVCSVRGSTVDISCTFKYPEKQHDLSTTVLETLWFTKEDRNQKPVDLLSDADYTGRVESSCGEISCIGSSCNRKCTLSIRDLRQSDSAVYNFRFKTNQPGGEHTANTGVALSNYVVLHLCHLFSDPDLQVKVSLRDDRYIKLECDSMCGNPPIIWYRNGQYYGQERSYWVSINSVSSYSCAVEGYERLHAPSVCKSTPSLSTATHEEVNNFRVTKIGQIKYQNQVRPVAPFFHFIFLIEHKIETIMALFLKYFSGLPGNSCHRVSYPTRTMCVLQGTSVDISCTYSHPQYAQLYYKYWFKWRANQEPRDLQADSGYKGRVEYPVEETGRSTLRITDLRVTDSAEYRFTFKTSQHEWKSILHGTTLTVTGLRVEVTPVATVTEGQRVTLTCITSCPLADKPSYIWYQNNGPVTGSENPENQLVLDPVGPQHAGSYSCSVRNYPHLRSPEETLTVQCTMNKSSSLTTVAVGTVAVLLVTILLLIFLCMRRKRASRKARGQRGRPDTGEQALPDPVYDNVLPLTNRLAPAAQREPIEEQDDLHYASIHISHSENQEVPRRSAGSPVQSRQTEEPPSLHVCCDHAFHQLNLCVLFILNEMCLFFTALQGNDDWTVTCTSSNVCSVRGSTVDISCTFKYPEKQHNLSTTVLETLWFTKEDRNQKPVDLLSDADYTGRVESSCGEISCIGSSCNRKCTLSIRDLRQSDSAVYNFRFKTNQPGGEHTANPGVALTNYVVLHLCHLFSDPDLQVKVSPRDDRSRNLECDSMCANPTIIWYMNGERVAQGRSYWDNINPIYSYACAVEGYKRLHSPSVCKSTPHSMFFHSHHISAVKTTAIMALFLIYFSGLQGNSCNRVSYPTRTMCVLQGTSVDISCTYSHPSYATLNYTYWFKWRANQEPRDLQSDSEYEGRAEYPVEETGRSTLTITDLRHTDSAEYCFKFKASYYEWKSISHGTTLTVTGLRVEVTPVATVTEGQRVTLTCITSCPLADKRSYIWYQNNGPVTGSENPENQLVLDPVGPQHAGSYSCSVRNYPHLRSPEETLTKKEGFQKSLWPARKARYRGAAQREPIEEQDDLHYASIHISHSENQEVPCRSAGSPVQSRQTEEVLYSLANFIRPNALNLCVLFILNEMCLFFTALQGNDDWTVTCTSSNVCPLRGSTVDISCTFKYPEKQHDLSTTVLETLWFTKEDRNHKPVDLLSDADYTGRVESSCGEISCIGSSCNRKCTLSIRDLRQSDSAVYNFRFKTNQPGGEHTANPGVALTVTDLQVKVSPWDYQTIKLECDSMCGNPPIIWYWNGQYLGQARSIGVSINSIDSYSCAVEGYERLHSPSVSVMALFLIYFSGLPGNSCFRVSYPTRTMCVLQGTSVNISCTYSHPPDATLKYTYWFKWRANQEPRDLQADSEYEGRAEYPVEETGRSTLRITDLRVTDSAEYRFTFITSYFEWKGILHGTTLTVTGLRVEVTPVATVTEGQRVTLTCITSCPLADKPSYIWYQNNGSVTGSENPENQLVLDPVGPQHAGSYSCSVRNYPHLRSPEETLTVQCTMNAPQTPSVSVSPSGEVVEGSSVTLSCSSDANPAANYTWFKEHEDSVGEPGQNYTITNITSELGGHYYCQAHNAIGRHNSTLLFINVTALNHCFPDKSSSLTTVAVRTVAVLLVTMVILLLIILWMSLSLSLSLSLLNVSVVSTRRKRASRKACGQRGRPDTGEEPLPGPEYENLPLTNRLAPAAQREPIEEQDDIHNRTRKCLTVRLTPLSNQTEQVLHVFNFKRPNAVPEDADQTSELYSTIK